jgi:PPP family 3-phenylpropionic acid transporter
VRRRLSAYYLLFFLAAGSSGPFLTLLLHARGYTSARIGLMLAAGALVGSLIQPFIGHLNDRLGRPRGILFAAAALSPLLFFGYVWASSFVLLVLIAVLANIVQGAFPIADAVAIHQSHDEHFAYGDVRLYGALGYALMVALAGWFYHRHGYDVAVLVYAVMTVPLLVVIALFPSRIQGHSASPGIRGQVWDLLRIKTLMAFITISFVVMIAVTMNGTFLPLYYQALHYPLAWVGLNFTVAAGVEIPFFYWSGPLIKRIGAMNTVALGTAAYALKYLIMALAPGALVVIVVQSLDGVAFALFWSASVEVVNQLAPRHQKSSAQTLYGALASNLSGIIATAVGGWILSRFGPQALYSIMTGSTALMLAPLWWLIHSVQRRAVGSEELDGR